MNDFWSIMDAHNNEGVENVDNTAVTPTVGVTTSIPTAGVTTVTPNTGVAASIPTAGVTAVTPNTGVAASIPTAGVTAVTPNAGVTTVTPTAGVAASIPTAGVTAVTPNTGVTAVTPNAGVTTSVPVAEANPNSSDIFAPNEQLSQTQKDLASSEKANKSSKKSSSTKKDSSKSKDKPTPAAYKYSRPRELPVYFGGVEYFKMPLELELHGMDEFEYIKNKLAELKVTEAKTPGYEVEDKGNHFRLVRRAYQSKG